MGNLDLSMVKTIKISEETHGDLIKIGTKAETFDGIIRRLIEFYRKEERRK